MTDHETHLPTASFDSLPNDKRLDQSKLKSFPDDKVNDIIQLKFDLERAENIVGKGENDGYNGRYCREY